MIITDQGPKWSQKKLFQIISKRIINTAAEVIDIDSLWIQIFILSISFPQPTTQDKVMELNSFCISVHHSTSLSVRKSERYFVFVSPYLLSKQTDGLRQCARVNGSQSLRMYTANVETFSGLALPGLLGCFVDVCTLLTSQCQIDLFHSIPSVNWEYVNGHRSNNGFPMRLLPIWERKYITSPLWIHPDNSKTALH